MPDSASLATPSSRYLAIKHAQALFAAPPEALSAEQLQRVSDIVSRQRQIEQRVLATPQAQQVSITPAMVDAGIAEIMSRFASEADFICTLAKQGLTQAALREELARDLKLEAVLAAVSASLPAVSQADIEIFYHLHADRWHKPERRTVRHILVTINAQLASNLRTVARNRIEAVRQTCLRDPQAFAKQALRHSECPTAMQGGLLGPVAQGQLFPALDAALFQMQAGQLSAVLESPMGFHLLRCDQIHPAGRVPLDKVRAKIHEQILNTRRSNYQRAWLRSLPAVD